MIQETLELIARALNTFLRNSDLRSSDPQRDQWVILSNVTDHKGELYKETENKIVMFLANIKHETTVSTYNPAAPVKNHQYTALPPPLYIDLFVLFFANFYNQTYGTGLDMISRVISFFQQRPVFTQESLPNLNPAIEKLALEISNLDLLDLSYLMGMMGTQYLPSAYYKVRMLPFTSNTMQQEIPAAQGIQAPSRPKHDEPTARAAQAKKRTLETRD